LRWARLCLTICAVGLLAWCGFVLIDARIFREAEDRQLSLAPAGHGIAPLAAAPGLIGRMEIPRLALSVIVMEGTSSRTLRRAAGHVAGTALPGQRGNVGISGHRDTFFRPLRNIERDDVITITTAMGEYRYRVISTVIVGPDDVSVLDASDNETLTLVTCYPFYFVGPAPKRFIVRAERVG
jgi:sortase A